MTPFSPADAALEGFRTVREHPRTPLLWGLIYVGLFFVSNYILVTMAGPAAQAMASMTLEQITAADPQTMLGYYVQILPAYLVLMLIALAIYSVLLPAALRMVLRPGESAGAFLRVGPAEGRQLVVIVVVSVLIFAVYVGAVLVGGIVGGILSLATPALAQIIIFLAILMAVGACLYVMVRLSLAGAQTLAEQRINIFGSWALTRGRFWPIFSTYFLAFALALVVGLLGLAIAVGAAAALGGGMAGVTAIFKPDLSSFQSYLRPSVIVYGIVLSFIQALTMPIMVCPSARLYQTLGGKGQTEVF